ncbi:DUF3626 domain-containing protein [Dankookia rubra]|uniref:DUF3626 domain-containing protein n=1 Tax=Dankookia rubra TaxID=1442381 RepID=A0A4R5QFV9_9PROT|nr:DUF3626 domain-containing protein [Dankookia rubra]TDH62164.1 DUF3626 domain-containing protein [Dankookia rubra]
MFAVERQGSRAKGVTPAARRNATTAQAASPERPASPRPLPVAGPAWSFADVPTVAPERAKASPARLPPVVARPPALPPLPIGRADDPSERQADRLAEAALRQPARRSCAACGECADCRTARLRRNRSDPPSPAPRLAPRVVHEVLRSPGRPLDPGLRGAMEQRFAHDFGRVRIHADAAAARSAQAVAANAYAVGERIVFGQGRFAPDTAAGRRLLAHELAHVVQQAGAGTPVVQRDVATGMEVVEPPSSGSILDRAFKAADEKRWEVAASLANQLSAFELRTFVQTLRDPELIAWLHHGALGAPGLGPDSAVAKATAAAHATVTRQRDQRQAQERAAQGGTPAAEAPLSVEERKQRCAAGQPGLKVFPLRLPRGMWRLSVAPINARRDGEDIVVSMPLNAVLGDRMFRAETKTLPLQTFTGGIRLRPDEVVRVRLYDDNDRMVCVTGEQMLKLSAATDDATLLSVLGTVLDAASIMAPGAGQAVSRGTSIALGVGMIGLNEGLEVARQHSAVQYGLQDHIRWGEITFDALLQLLTLGFGGRLADAATRRVASVATGPYTRPALQMAVEAVVHGSIAVFRSAAKRLFEQLQGERRPITVEAFLEELAKEFMQGLLFHAVMKMAAPGAGAPHGEPEGSGPRVAGGSGRPSSGARSTGEPVMLFDAAGTPIRVQGARQVPNAGPVDLHTTSRGPAVEVGRGGVPNIPPPGPVPLHLEPSGAPSLVGRENGVLVARPPSGPVPLYTDPHSSASYVWPRAGVIARPTAVPLYVTPTRAAQIAGGREVPMPEAPVPLYASPQQSGLYQGGQRVSGPYERPLVAANPAARSATVLAEQQAAGTSARLSAGPNERVASLVAGSDVRIRVRPGTLRSILGSGRLMTQFETGTSGGLLNRNMRRATEGALFGLEPDAPVGQRPIYGYLGGTAEATPAQYGSAVIRLRPEVRPRTTFTFGDSLDETFIGTRPAVAAEPLTQPTALASTPRNVGKGSLAELSPTRGAGPTYAEAQVHGGVTVQDIAEVVFTGGRMPDPGTRAQLEKAGIPWRVVDGDGP